MFMVNDKNPYGSRPKTRRTDRQKQKELPLSVGMGGEKSKDITTSLKHGV